MSPAFADLKVNRGGGVGTKLNGSLNGACRRGICKISGGMRKGKNKNILMHRVDTFDTRGGSIKKVKINNSKGKIQTIVLSVTDPRGAFLTVPTFLKRRSDFVLLSPGGIQLKGKGFHNVGSLSLIAKPSFKFDDLLFRAAASKSAVSKPITPGKIKISSNLSVDGNLLIDSMGEVRIQDSTIKAADSVQVVSKMPRGNIYVSYNPLAENQVSISNSSLGTAFGNLDIHVSRRLGTTNSAPVIDIDQSNLVAGGKMNIKGRINNLSRGSIAPVLEIDSSNLQAKRSLRVKGTLRDFQKSKDSIAVALSGRSSFASDREMQILGLFDSGVDLVRSHAVRIGHGSSDRASLSFRGPVKIIGKINDVQSSRSNTAIWGTESDLFAFDDIHLSADLRNISSSQFTFGVFLEDTSLLSNQIGSLLLSSNIYRVNDSIGDNGVVINRSNINYFRDVGIDSWADTSRVRVAGSLAIFLDQALLQAGSIRFSGYGASGVRRSAEFIQGQQSKPVDLRMKLDDTDNSGIWINKSRLSAERDIDINGMAGKFQSFFGENVSEPFGVYIFKSNLDSGRLVEIYGDGGSSYSGRTSLATGVHVFKSNLSSLKIDLMGDGGDIFHVSKASSQVDLDGNEGLLLESSRLDTSARSDLSFNSRTKNSIQLNGVGGDIQSEDASRFRFDVDAMNGVSILGSELISGDTAYWFGQSGNTPHGSDSNQGIYIEDSDIFFYDENLDRQETALLIGVSQSGTNNNHGVLVFNSTFISPNSDLAFDGKGAINASLSGELNRGIVFDNSLINVGVGAPYLDQIQKPLNKTKYDLTIFGSGGQGYMDNDGVVDFNSDITVTGDIIIDGTAIASGGLNASTFFKDTNLSAGGDLSVSGNTDSIFDQATVNVRGELSVTVDGAFVDHSSLHRSSVSTPDSNLKMQSMATQNYSKVNQISVDNFKTVQLDRSDIQNSIEASEAALFSDLGSVVQTSFSTPLSLKEMQAMLQNEIKAIQRRP